VTTGGSRLRILYVGGWGRSGSTLVDRLLDQVPDIVAVGEMRDLFLRGPVEDRLCGCGERFSACPFWTAVGDRAFGGWSSIDARALVAMRLRLDRPWDLPMLIRPTVSGRYSAEHGRFVEALRATYRAIVDVSGARVIVDSSKIPTFAMLLRAVPGADVRMLHLIRDSRGVLFSWRKSVVKPDRPEDPELMLRYGPFQASARYVFYNGLTEALRITGMPYLRVRYEDVTADPAASLERIVAFAGCDRGVGSSVLDGGGVDLAPGHNVDGNPMRFKQGATTIRADDAWRHQMSSTDRRVASMLTAPLLLRYGYRLRP
jgi:hypothetical protein